MTHEKFTPTTIDLGNGLSFQVGRLPEHLLWDDAMFERVWALRPAEKPVIVVHGKPVRAPRWMQPYGADYHFSGGNKLALPVPEILQPLLSWSQTVVDPHLNGLLINSYEPDDYIGPHRDSRKHMVKGCPIVTISFGETRTFRLTLREKKAVVQTKDFEATAGTVFVTPYSTNLVWYHGVPKSKSYTGRRISVTMRGFDKGVVEAKQSA